MSEDVEIFDLEVWESKNIQIEAFSIQGHEPESEVFESPNLRFEAFNILGSYPRMLKYSIWRFGNPKTSKQKLLVSRDMAPGC